VRHSLKAFTLIELTVVIAVLALLAAAVMPFLAAAEVGGKERAFLSNLKGLAIEGRETAINSGRDVTLTYDDTNNAFTLKTTDSNGDDQDIKSEDMPPSLKTTKFEVGTQDSNAGDWKVLFYPDGTSDGGGVEIARGNDTLSLYIDKSTGRSQMISDQLPDPKADSWTAGDYVHRTSS